MRHTSSTPTLCVLAVLFASTGAACGDDAAESEACRAYKDALASQAFCDPEFTTPLGPDDSYDQYRCRTDQELMDESLDEGLSECAEYLETLLGPEVESGRRNCDISLGERERCKTGYLVFEGGRDLPSDEVGNACQLPSVPQDGFRADEVYLQLFSEQCMFCLVEGLEGDPSEDCDPVSSTCPSAEEVEDGMYCSCRCDTDDPDVATCACPDGFECREALGRGGPGIVGSYCMRAE